MEAFVIGGATIISGLLGLLGLVAQRARRENNTAHDQNMALLKSIDQRSQSMDHKLDEHGEWIAGHAEWHRAVDPPDQKWKSAD